MRYWVYKDSEILGPLVPEEFEQLEGLDASVLVCPENRAGEGSGEPAWMSLSEVPELARVLEGVPVLSAAVLAEAGLGEPAVEPEQAAPFLELPEDPGAPQEAASAQAPGIGPVEERLEALVRKIEHYESLQNDILERLGQKERLLEERDRRIGVLESELSQLRERGTQEAQPAAAAPPAALAPAASSDPLGTAGALLLWLQQKDQSIEEKELRIRQLEQALQGRSAAEAPAPEPEAEPSAPAPEAAAPVRGGADAPQEEFPEAPVETPAQEAAREEASEEGELLRLPPAVLLSIASPSGEIQPEDFLPPIAPEPEAPAPSEPEQPQENAEAPEPQVELPQPSAASFEEETAPAAAAGGWSVPALEPDAPPPASLDPILETPAREAPLVEFGPLEQTPKPALPREPAPSRMEPSEPAYPEILLGMDAFAQAHGAGADAPPVWGQEPPTEPSGEEVPPPRSVGKRPPARRDASPDETQGASVAPPPGEEPTPAWGAPPSLSGPQEPASVFAAAVPPAPPAIPAPPASELVEQTPRPPAPTPVQAQETQDSWPATPARRRRQSRMPMLILMGALAVLLAAVWMLLLQDPRDLLSLFGPKRRALTEPEEMLGAAPAPGAPISPKGRASGEQPRPTSDISAETGRTDTDPRPVPGAAMPSTPSPGPQAAPPPAAPPAGPAHGRDYIADAAPQAIALVKKFALNGGRRNIAAWLQYSFLSPGSVEEWTANPREANVYFVQYRLLKQGRGAAKEPITYIFEADLNRKAVLGINPPAKQLLAGASARRQAKRPAASGGRARSQAAADRKKPRKAASTLPSGGSSPPFDLPGF